MEKRARLQRLIGKVVGTSVAITVVGATIVAGFSAASNKWPDLIRLPSFDSRSNATSVSTLAAAEPSMMPDSVVTRATAPLGVPPDTSASNAIPAASDSVVAEISTSDSVVPAAVPAPAPAEPAPRVAPGAAPLIAEGRTELGDSLYAVREGPVVTVYFDTRVTRTRRRDKFDRIVRATLPMVYGAMADSLLATIPEGEIARAGDLVSELPTRGIRFSLTNGSTLALFPSTRPGRDGPLVVGYRATITP